MHPRIFDQQRRAAIARIDGAARKMAEANGVDASLVDAMSCYHDRDPEVNRLRQLEATARLLETLAERGCALQSENADLHAVMTDAQAERDRLRAKAEQPRRGPGRPPKVVTV